MTPDLAALLADPARAVEVPVEAIASVLTEVSAREARLGILAARLGVPPAPSNGRRHDDAVLTDVETSPGQRFTRVQREGEVRQRPGVVDLMLALPSRRAT